MSANLIILCNQDLYLCADIKELENKNKFSTAQYFLKLEWLFVSVRVFLYVFVHHEMCVFELENKRIDCIYGYSSQERQGLLLQTHISSLAHNKIRRKTYIYVSFCYSLFSAQAILVCHEKDLGLKKKWASVVLRCIKMTKRICDD